MPLDSAKPSAPARAVQARRLAAAHPQLAQQVRCSSGFTHAPSGRIMAWPGQARAAVSSVANGLTARPRRPDRPWTPGEVVKAVCLRAASRGDPEIGCALDRHPGCIGQKIGRVRDDGPLRPLLQVPQGQEAALFAELVSLAARGAALPGLLALLTRLGPDWHRDDVLRAVAGLVRLGAIELALAPDGDWQAVTLLPNGRVLRRGEAIHG